MVSSALNYANRLKRNNNKGPLGQVELFDTSAQVSKKMSVLYDFMIESEMAIVHTGAGVSTGSGIPDFRGPSGIWTIMNTSKEEEEEDEGECSDGPNEGQVSKRRGRPRKKLTDANCIPTRKMVVEERIVTRSKAKNKENEEESNMSPSQNAENVIQSTDDDPNNTNTNTNGIDTNTNTNGINTNTNMNGINTNNNMNGIDSSIANHGKEAAVFRKTGTEIDTNNGSNNDDSLIDNTNNTDTNSINSNMNNNNADNGNGVNNEHSCQGESNVIETVKRKRGRPRKIKAIEENSKEADETSEPQENYKDKLRESTKTDGSVKNGEKLHDENGKEEDIKPESDGSEDGEVNKSEYVVYGNKKTKAVEFILALPSEAHLCILQLLKTEKIKFIITQNIDGLHSLSGVPFNKLAELHGNVFVQRCLHCARRFQRSYVAPTISFHATGDLCGLCSFPPLNLLTDVVLDWFDCYEEHYENISTRKAEDADFHLSLGTSLHIEPACHYASNDYHRKLDAPLVIVNYQSTKLDSESDLIIHDDVNKVCTSLLKKFDMQIPVFKRKSHLIVLKHQLVDNNCVMIIKLSSINSMRVLTDERGTGDYSNSLKNPLDDPPNGFKDGVEWECVNKVQGIYKFTFNKNFGIRLSLFYETQLIVEVPYERVPLFKAEIWELDICATNGSKLKVSPNTFTPDKSEDKKNPDTKIGPLEQISVSRDYDLNNDYDGDDEEDVEEEDDDEEYVDSDYVPKNNHRKNRNSKKDRRNKKNDYKEYVDESDHMNEENNEEENVNDDENDNEEHGDSQHHKYDLRHRLMCSNEENGSNSDSDTDSNIGSNSNSNSNSGSNASSSASDDDDDDTPNRVNTNGYRRGTLRSSRLRNGSCRSDPHVSYNRSSKYRDAKFAGWERGMPRMVNGNDPVNSLIVIHEMKIRFNSHLIDELPFRMVGYLDLINNRSEEYEEYKVPNSMVMLSYLWGSHKIQNVQNVHYPASVVESFINVSNTSDELFKSDRSSENDDVKPLKKTRSGGREHKRRERGESPENSKTKKTRYEDDSDYELSSSISFGESSTDHFSDVETNESNNGSPSRRKQEESDYDKTTLDFINHVAGMTYKRPKIGNKDAGLKRGMGILPPLTKFGGVPKAGALRRINRMIKLGEISTEGAVATGIIPENADIGATHVRNLNSFGTTRGRSPFGTINTVGEFDGINTLGVVDGINTLGVVDGISGFGAIDGISSFDALDRIRSLSELEGIGTLGGASEFGATAAFAGLDAFNVADTLETVDILGEHRNFGVIDESGEISALDEQSTVSRVPDRTPRSKPADSSTSSKGAETSETNKGGDSVPSTKPDDPVATSKGADSSECSKPVDPVASSKVSKRNLHSNVGLRRSARLIGGVSGPSRRLGSNGFGVADVLCAASRLNVFTEGAESNLAIGLGGVDMAQRIRELGGFSGLAGVGRVTRGSGIELTGAGMSRGLGAIPFMRTSQHNGNIGPAGSADSGILGEIFGSMHSASKDMGGQKNSDMDKLGRLDISVSTGIDLGDRIDIIDPLSMSEAGGTHMRRPSGIDMNERLNIVDPLNIAETSGMNEEHEERMSMEQDDTVSIDNDKGIGMERCENDLNQLDTMGLNQSNRMGRRFSGLSELSGLTEFNGLNEFNAPNRVGGVGRMVDHMFVPSENINRQPKMQTKYQIKSENGMYGDKDILKSYYDNYIKTTSTAHDTANGPGGNDQGTIKKKSKIWKEMLETSKINELIIKKSLRMRLITMKNNKLTADIDKLHLEKYYLSLSSSLPLKLFISKESKLGYLVDKVPREVVESNKNGNYKHYHRIFNHFDLHELLEGTEQNYFYHFYTPEERKKEIREQNIYIPEKVDTSEESCDEYMYFGKTQQRGRKDQHPSIRDKKLLMIGRNEIMGLRVNVFELMAYNVIKRSRDFSHVENYVIVKLFYQHLPLWIVKYLSDLFECR